MTDPTLIEQELLPCPFCALRLREDGQEWHHEMADCPLSDCVFDETQVAEWNTRARQGSAVLPSEAMIEDACFAWLRTLFPADASDEEIRSRIKDTDREHIKTILTAALPAMRAATPTAPDQP